MNSRIINPIGLYTVDNSATIENRL